MCLCHRACNIAPRVFQEVAGEPCPILPQNLADFLDSDRDQVIEAVLSCPVEALLLEFDNGRTITSRANEEGGLDKWLRY